MSLTDMVQEIHQIYGRLRRVGQLSEREPGGDWYDTIHPDLDDWMRRLSSYRGNSDDLDLLIDRIVSSYAADLSLPDAVEVDLLRKLDLDPDGPITGGWRHDGINYQGLRDRPHQLASYLWDNGRICEVDDLTLVFGDHARNLNTGWAVQSARRDANSFFRVHRIPFRVETRSKPDRFADQKRLVSLVDHEWPEES